MLFCGNGPALDGLEGPLDHRERHHGAGGAVLCRVRLWKQREGEDQHLDSRGRSRFF